MIILGVMRIVLSALLLFLACSCSASCLVACGEETHRGIGTSPSGPTQVDDEPEGLSAEVDAGAL